MGSARTVAVVCRDDGFWQPLQFDGQPWLHSGVYRCGSGPVLTGGQALAAAMADPGNYLPDPAGRISGDAVDLGDGTLPGVHLVGTVLRRVLDETVEACDGPVPEVVVVIPPGWGPPRRALLRQAAQYAGVREPVLVPAAEAVAGRGDGIDVPVARWVVVCDLGARATVSVVRRTVSGYEVLAELDGDAGGNRIDDALATRLAAASTSPTPTLTPATGVGPDVGGAARGAAGSLSTTGPGGSDHHRPAPGAADSAPQPTWMTRMTVRTAKEATTDVPAVVIPTTAANAVNGRFPGGEPVAAMVLLTAAQVQAAAAPVIDTVATLIRQAVEAAQVPTETGCGLLLVGGTTAIAGIDNRLQTGTGLHTRVLPRPALAAVCAATNAGRYEAPDPAVRHRSRRTQPVAGPPAPPATGRSATMAAALSTKLPAALSRRLSAAKPAGLPSWPQLLAPLVPAVASVLLAFHAIANAYVINPTWSPDDPRHMGLNDGQMVMAAVLAVVAGAALGAHYGPLLRPDLPPADRRVPAGLPVAAGLLSGAGIGVAVVALYAGLGSAYHDGAFVWRIMRWTMPAAIPVAAIVAVAARLVFRGAPEPRSGWGPALTVPHPPIVLASIGMAAITWIANYGSPAAFTDTWEPTILRCSGLLLGLATTYLIAERRTTQIIAAIPLVTLMIIAADYSTAEILGFMWIVALACWWIRRTWQIGTYGIPYHRRPDTGWA